jgi:hypothetical protein
VLEVGTVNWDQVLGVLEAGEINDIATARVAGDQKLYEIYYATRDRRCMGPKPKARRK